ncbi:SNF2 family N-terminal domain-containing protein [Parasitella parasitica]|nr:SNF2 family N-terminal domain-containing protein [Parasitella parasitica]
MVVVVNGALVKEDALLSYLHEFKLQETGNSNRCHSTLQTIEIASKNDSRSINFSNSNVAFPLSLPGLKDVEARYLLAGHKNCKTQRLSLEWQYAKVRGTIKTALKVYSASKHQLLLEHRFVINADHFEEDNATELIGLDQSFVSLAYAIQSSLINASNAVIRPTGPNQTLTLLVQLKFTANANRRSKLSLVDALSRKFDIKLGNMSLATNTISEVNTTNRLLGDSKNTNMSTSQFKRKRDGSSQPDISVPLLKKALTLYPASTTLERKRRPVPPVSSLETFYGYIQPDVSEYRPENYATAKITAKLSPFQLQNVKWMISREGHVANEQGGVEPDPSIFACLPLLYTGAHETDETGNYIDCITGETSTSRAQISKLIQLSYSGGILSDEMGLGKTVSVLNLIAKHTYNPKDPSHPRAEDVGALTFSKGTLIVTPGSIISQWQSEIKKHAPQLSVFIYEGRRFQKETNAQDLAQYDIVLVYYEAFRQEIYYSEPPRKRPQRNGVTYNRNREFNQSPLVSTFWFRCILDEAQMIEGHVSAVVAVAKKIPRWYAWAVTGTPIKSDFNDLHGLYDFISIAPSIIKTPDIFAAFCHDPNYMSVFYDFACSTIRRNTKHSLENQVHIPKQSRHVVRFPFTTIEQHYYDDLWRECKSNIGLDELDNNNWSLNLESKDTLRSRMRNWLVALRQGCIHPSLIANTSLRLKSSKTTTNGVQTMSEVLHDMAKTAGINLDHNQYGYYQLKLSKGGMFEVLRDLHKAIEIYSENVVHVEELVEARCEDSRRYFAKAKVLEKAGSSVRDTLDMSESKSHTKWQTLLHRYYFYMAGVYHAMSLEDKETDFYNKAGDIRRDLLESYTDRVKTHTFEMRRAANNINNDPGYLYGSRNFELDFSTIVNAREEDGNLPEYVDHRQTQEDLNTVENMKGVGYILDQQLEKILYLRIKIMPILTKSLVDGDKNAEATGQEYDNSLAQQEICQIYLSAYKSLLQDRKFIINGTTVSADIIALGNDDAEEKETQSKEATRIEAAEKAFRNQLMAPANFKVECLRDVEVQSRDIKRKIKVNRRKNTSILNDEQAYIRSKMPAQTKLVEDLDNDLKKLTQLFNSRIAYYKYLQSISDTLLEWQSDNPRREIEKIDTETEKLTEIISQNKSRDMYFKALVEEQETRKSSKGKPRDCLICQDPIEKGMITYCGHSSCYNCGVQWFKTSRRCHTCNSSVKPFEWYRVSYNEMVMHDRDQSEEFRNGIDSIDGRSATEITSVKITRRDDRIEKLIKEIKRQHISSSQGAKIDSIVRHIKHIKTENNGKCVVFSQWSKVLTMIKTGLHMNGIQCTTVDAGAGSAASKNKVAKFQQDPNINVILLDAKSQSSGLTLVEAHTAFIVEPVINESLEKQAINRIHRIGQTEETAVYWYIVQDTIEERIHAIHDIKRSHNKNNNATKDIEKAQMSKQSDGGGEFVDDDDLRRCFTSDKTYALH